MATMTGAASASAMAARARRPSFPGLMRGEWIKVSRQKTFWIMLGLMVVGYLLFAMILASGGRHPGRIRADPQGMLYVSSQSTLFLLRVFWGMMMIILTARLIGMEYSSGAIRVTLARGVGRLQLLAAKLSVLGLIALIGGALLVIFSFLVTLLAVRVSVGDLDAFSKTDAIFWQNTWAYIASVVVSLGVSMLMAAAVTSLTRSLAAGISIAIAWFPVDNFALLLLFLGSGLTGWKFWSLVSGDFLGPNLNQMSTVMLTNPQLSTIDNFFAPLVPVTGAHTLLVAGVYAAIFIAVMIAMTVIPDVKE